MKCLKCGHTWKRTKAREFVTGLSKCPKCGSRLVARYRSPGSIWRIIL